MADPRTHIPAAVKRELRQEVGFVCPVSECFVPFLTWHHFTPPWRVEHHNRPEGMIALCRIHADQADNGAFTDDQLREMKAGAAAEAKLVSARLNWLRNDLLAVLGGNFYYNVPTILQIGKTKCVWFERDERQNLLLNLRMPSLTDRPRARIENNVWSISPAVDEVVCPPMGRLIEVKYGNGDYFKAEFFEVADSAALVRRYPLMASRAAECRFPLTVVELTETAPGTLVDIGPDGVHFTGHLRGSFMRSTVIGQRLNISPEEERRLFAASS